MTENTRTRNHQLIGAGAAHDEDGDRLFSNTTSGTGRALCSCGWLSDPVEFGRQRKNLLKAHAASFAAESPPASAITPSSSASSSSRCRLSRARTSAIDPPPTASPSSSVRITGRLTADCTFFVRADPA